MKTKIILSLILFFQIISGFSTVWNVSNSGFTFSPATITINLGDTVNFSISGSHNAEEVSQATWNINDNTPLSGGFSVNYGGGMVLPAELAVGTHYYVCTPHASMGMKGTIIVQGCSVPSQPGTISGNISLCSGSTNTYSITAVSGATSYTWTLPVGWTGGSTTNSITTVAGSTAGNISVTANNSCGASVVRTLAVSTSTAVPAQPASISGNTSVCSGSSNVYNIAVVSGATSYTWSLPVGWTGSSTTNTLTTIAGTNSGTVSVTANNVCGVSVARTLAVTTNTVPSQPASISGNATVCSGSANSYSVASVSGATSYTWSLPVGWTGSSTTNTITTTAGTSSGTISVTANNSCGASVLRTLAIISNSIPSQPATISGNASVCSGSSNSFSIAAVGGANSYTWTLPVGWTGGSTSSTISVVAGTSSGTISVTANNSCGSSVVRTLAVTTNTLPSQPTAISGNASVCSGSTNTYTITTVSGAASYTWTLPNGWTGVSTSNSISAVSGSASGTISVTANNVCGSSVARTIAVTSNTVPTQPASIIGNASICSGSSNIYSVSAVNGASSYTWTLPSGWVGGSSTTTITAVAASNSGNVSVTANNSCGSSAAQTLNVMNNFIDKTVNVSGLTLTSNTNAANYQWINCNTNLPISGQINQSYTATSNGSYAVIITKNSCIDTSNCTVVNNVGINNTTLNSYIQVYPNPSNGNFIVENTKIQDGKIEIFNIIGEKVFESESTNIKNEINISNKPKGVYFVKIFNINTSNIQRIVIK